MVEADSRERASLSEEDLEGGLLYWGPWVMRERLWRWISLFMGSQLGNLAWDSFIHSFIFTPLIHTRSQQPKGCGTCQNTNTQ